MSCELTRFTSSSSNAIEIKEERERTKKKIRFPFGHSAIRRHRHVINKLLFSQLRKL